MSDNATLNATLVDRVLGLCGAMRAQDASTLEEAAARIAALESERDHWRKLYVWPEDAVRTAVLTEREAIVTLIAQACTYGTAVKLAELIRARPAP